MNDTATAVAPLEVIFGMNVYRLFKDGQYRKVCLKCNGTGQTSFVWVDNGVCYRCEGRGIDRTVKPLDLHDLRKREAKWIAADTAKKQEREKLRQRQEAAAAARQAERDAQRTERAAKSRFINCERGDKVEMTVEVLHRTLVDTQFGSSILVIAQDEMGAKVKFFTTAQFVWDQETNADGDLVHVVRKGRTIKIKAVVKDFEVYNDEKSTLLTRPKLVA